MATGDEKFSNTSPLTMARLLDDPTNIAGNLRNYLLALGGSGRVQGRPGGPEPDRFAGVA